MRPFNAKFELFCAVRGPAEIWNTENAAECEIARMGEAPKVARKYKSSGNEAKESLKTKDITFLNAANHACFERKLAPFNA